jgi:hypothetical protein
VRAFLLTTCSLTSTQARPLLGARVEFFRECLVCCVRPCNCACVRAFRTPLLSAPTCHSCCAYLLIVQLNEVCCRQQLPGLVLQVEPAAVSACTQGDHLAHRRHPHPAAARRLTGRCCCCRCCCCSCCCFRCCSRLAVRRSSVLLRACCDEVMCDLPHDCMAGPCAPVDDGGLAAGQGLVQQRQDHVREVAQGRT